MQTIKQINDILTPAYVLEEAKLRKNLELLAKIKQDAGVKIVLALKGFSFTKALDYVAKYLDGCAASGLWEAKLGKKYIQKEVFTYSPAFKQSEFDDICKLSSHIVFNSLSQLKSFGPQARAHNSLGIRCNIEFSLASREIYNPCARFSRLGVKSKELLAASDADLALLEGLHFHALCEQGVDEFEKVLLRFEEKFSPIFSRIKWVNFGGGMLITKKGFDVDKLINLLIKFKQKYNLDIILEPGEAVAWQCGYLVASVLDIVENEKQIAILDTSNEAHMPDTVIMPYTSEVYGAKIISSREEIGKNDDDLNKASGPSAKELVNEMFDNYLEKKRIKEDKHRYILAGNTCLAGDVMGEYEFNHPLSIGDKVLFCDQIHYSVVKNNTFNGIVLPSLVFLQENGSMISKKFDYSDYERRN